MITLFYSFILFLHPIHLSVSEINYSEKDKALQITSRIFLDDLELSIRNQRKQPDLDLLEPGPGLTTEQLISDYVIKHFSVKLDGKIQKLNFLGFEREDPAVICYIEIENVKKFKVIEVKNEVIMETHDDQSNLIHVTYKGPVKSLRLMRDKSSDVLTFESK
ncbi:MAG TPA: hypothetical protein PKJ83_09130 [Cyclobacteriaceae bacterium]|nr:hypothetical protein [Cyclobacteriaceae bacterium]HPW62709.1 hypothetical protein [Cyclobacteriaceae bacterium]